MKLYAPKYYKEFKCIAHKCDHSCCIGWEIDIDDTTLKKYKSLKHPYAEEIHQSIDYEETPHFKLCTGERCTHLDKNGLCKIILNIGEDYLCHICREHPRFYNYTRVAEVGLGMSCREAARLILLSDNYDVMEKIGEVDIEDDGVEFDGITERNKVYAILKDESMSYAARLERIYNYYQIRVDDDNTTPALLDSLEYLDDSHKVLFDCYSSQKRLSKYDKYLESALAYFVYRHCTEAVDLEDFEDRLSFALLCERLLASVLYAQAPSTIEEIAILASIISEEIEYSEDNIQTLMYLFSSLWLAIALNTPPAFQWV